MFASFTEPFGTNYPYLLLLDTSARPWKYQNKKLNNQSLDELLTGEIVWTDAPDPSN